MKLSIVIPCLNEAKAIGACVKEAKQSLLALKIDGEVVVADNGSTDDSKEIATKAGARVVHVQERGYGSALRNGIISAQGEFVIMGDGDGSYDFTEIGRFMEKFDQGYDLVMGNRFRGGIEPGAMPFMNKHIGNPALTFITRVLFGKAFGDTQCGLRGGKRQVILDMNLKSDHMEYASEMVVKALKSPLRLAEVPVKLRNDDPSRRPHLRPFRDGIRHLKFLLCEKFTT